MFSVGYWQCFPEQQIKKDKDKMGNKNNESNRN